MFKCGKKKTAREEASAQVIQEEYKKLGPIRFVKLHNFKQEPKYSCKFRKTYNPFCFCYSYPEIVTLVLFILMTLLWFTRDPGFIPGWSSLFPK